MEFNIIAPYMEFLHLKWYIAEWLLKHTCGPSWKNDLNNVVGIDDIKGWRRK